MRPGRLGTGVLFRGGTGVVKAIDLSGIEPIESKETLSRD